MRSSLAKPGAVAAMLIAVGWAATTALGQPVLYVDDDAPLHGDGLTWGTAFKYLQDALSVASADPTFTEIRVGSGTYQADRDESGAVTPGDRLATFGLLDGVALQGGYAGWADPGDPDVRNSNVYSSTLTGDLSGNDNPADFPGGLTYAENTCQVLTGSWNGPAAIVDGFTVTAGFAEDPGITNWSGGGMFIDSGSPTVSNCTFVGNSASYSGGAVYAYNGTPALTNCVFAGNDGAYGGAMENVLADTIMVNCVFTGNHCSGDS